MTTTIHGTAAAAGTLTRYASVAQVKVRLGITDVTDDTPLAMILDGISRALDRECRRRFYVTSSDETRYFTALNNGLVLCGDLVSVTTIKVDDNGDRTFGAAWADTDYDLEPFNAALDDQPYRLIRTAVNGTTSFPTISKGVQVIGKFGWPTVPEQVIEATLLTAERLFKRREAIFGIVGTADLGELRQILKEDPEIQMLLVGMRDRSRLFG